MKTSKEVQKCVLKYQESCTKQNKKPTYKGLGYVLGITGATVKHIVKGQYKIGKPYTEKPHTTRCIANADFGLIQELYELLPIE